MISHLDHLVLTTTDEAACVDFYTRVLGMTLEPFCTGGDPALNGLLAGTGGFTITTPPPRLPHLRAGRHQALRVTGHSWCQRAHSVEPRGDAGPHQGRLKPPGAKKLSNQQLVTLVLLEEKAIFIFFQVTTQVAFQLEAQ